MTDLVGKDIGRYHLTEKIGEGGMAVVYKATDTRLQRTVAVKLILPGRESSAEFLKRFEIEARTLAQLNHDNILLILDFGEQDGISYLVTPYIDGGSLKQRMGTAVPYWEAARLLAPVARALEYTHRQHVIHRDIKPGNILLTAEGKPLLADFGIAKIFQAEQTLGLTLTGAVIGTPEYMAPEQATGNEIDERADIYSLGVVYFEMITGRRPFEADTPYSVIIKKVSDPLPKAGDFAPGLPKEVENTLAKAMAKDPGDRFTTMGALAAELEGHSLKIPPQQVRAQKKERSKPKPKLFARMAAGLAGLILLLGISFYYFAFVRKDTGVIGAVHAETTATLSSVTTTPVLEASPTAAPTLPKAASPTAAPTYQQETPLPAGTVRRSSKDGMEMVYVPAGDYIQNIPTNKTLPGNVGVVYEQVTLSVHAFWIDKTEVTNGMYELCVKDGSCQPPANARSHLRSNYYGDSRYVDYPVIYIFDTTSAREYCLWAGKRMPTYNEWEKAAGGTDGRPYPWGNTPPNPSLLNYYSSQINDTTKVGSYPDGASPYGALDMAGNVWEWLSDGTIRGGAFNYAERGAMVGATGGLLSGDNSGNNLGFRCAADRVP